MDNYDPLLAARVLSAIVPQEEAHESPPQAPEAPVPSLEALESLASPKRKAEEPAPRTSKKKKTDE